MRSPNSMASEAVAAPSPSAPPTVLNALEVLERMGYDADHIATAATLLMVMGERGMFVIDNPLAASTSAEAKEQPTAPKEAPRHLTDNLCPYLAAEWAICNKCGRIHNGQPHPRVPFDVSSPAGATAADAAHAAWLADKIVALGDYAKEAAEMLRRWPSVHSAAPQANRKQESLAHQAVSTSSVPSAVHRAEGGENAPGAGGSAQ